MDVMVMKKEELRTIPTKNYIILGVVILVSILLLYYLYLWFDNYNETKLNMPILDKYMEVINYNELSDYLVENPDAIIYVSVLENSNIREFEKKMKSAFKKHEIEKDMLYMNITDDIKSVDKEKYSIGDVSILDVPLIMVFDNGKLNSIYSISKNDYDIQRLKIYIEEIHFSNDGEVNG